MREAVSLRPPLTTGPPPEEVARGLNILPCSLSFTPHSRVSLVSLIMEVRMGGKGEGRRKRREGEGRTWKVGGKDKGWVEKEGRERR